MALWPQEMAEDGDVAASLIEDVLAGDEAGAPFEFVGAVFFAVGVDIFLGDAVDDGSDFGPDAGARTHHAPPLRVLSLRND